MAAWDTYSVYVRDEAAARVARGLTWLKESGAFYGLDYTRINALTVNVADPYSCPLANASFTGRYSAVISRLHADPNSSARRDYLDWIGDHGFDVRVGDPANMYTLLNLAWRRALLRNKAKREEML